MAVLLSDRLAIAPSQGKQQVAVLPRRAIPSGEPRPDPVMEKDCVDLVMHARALAKGAETRWHEFVLSGAQDELPTRWPQTVQLAASNATSWTPISQADQLHSSTFDEVGSQWKWLARHTSRLRECNAMGWASQPMPGHSASAEGPAEDGLAKPEPQPPGVRYAIDWNQQMVVGIGVPVQSGGFQRSQVLLADATRQARAHLLEALLALTIDGRQTLRALTNENLVFRRRLLQLADSAAVVTKGESMVLGDGQWVEASLPLASPGGLWPLLLPFLATYGDADAPGDLKAVHRDVNHRDARDQESCYTSIILDARGLFPQRQLLVPLASSEGAPIYLHRLVNPNRIAGYGLSRYTSFEGQANLLAGDCPVRLRITEQHNGKMILSGAEHARLLAALPLARSVGPAVVVLSD